MIHPLFISRLIYWTRSMRLALLATSLALCPVALGQTPAGQPPPPGQQQAPVGTQQNAPVPMPGNQPVPSPQQPQAQSFVPAGGAQPASAPIEGLTLSQAMDRARLYSQ